MPAWVRGHLARMSARASRPHGCAGILPAGAHDAHNPGAWF